MDLEDIEFVEYWKGQDDEDIVSFLYEMDEDKLKEVVDVDKTIEFEDYDPKTFGVYQVIYNPGKRRKHLIDIIIILATKYKED